MSLDDNSYVPPPEQDSAANSGHSGNDQPSNSQSNLFPSGDSIDHAVGAPGHPHSFRPPLPEDLQISWSWTHFIVFFLFALTSFIVVQAVLAAHYLPRRPLSQEAMEDYLLNKPQFLFGTNLIWYASLFLFLYITLSVLHNAPFWESLGWRKLRPRVAGHPRNPWTYFFFGCGLALFVAIASARIPVKEDMPIQELLKSRSSAFLLMGMAVFVAPLVEETVFRGYLYPLFAKSFGIVSGVLLTGFLFGLMHGSQLGWSWQIVTLLIVVGIILTAVRAVTGTVFASFLVHLGYNSLIAITSIIGTHGFTRIPPS